MKVEQISRKYTFHKISAEQWKDILKDEKITDDKIIKIIEILLCTDDKRLNAKVIASIMGIYHFVTLNKIVGGYGHKICDRLGIDKFYVGGGDIIREEGTVRYWVTVFDGEDIKLSNRKTRCDWILKDEMLQAISELKAEKVMFSDLKARTVSRMRNRISEEEDYVNFSAKEREAIVKVRVGQSKFRENLRKRYDNRCCLCGLSVEPLLVASHIKEWSVSSPEEKADVNNGLLLCPNHDALFDKHLISFDGNGNILINKKLTSTEMSKLNINNDMKIAVSEMMMQYMNYHRKIFLSVNN